VTSRDFCYWLQGYLEINAADTAGSELTPPQVECIARHLNLVFKHEIDAPDPTGELQSAHDGKPVN
jgi:hypothetical protein